MNALARRMTSALSGVLAALHDDHTHHHQPSSASPSPAAAVPTEILLLVFVHCAPTQLAALARVCTAWRGPAQALLFSSVRLESTGALARLARTIRANPALAPLVRELDMPGVARVLGVPAATADGDARKAVWLAHTKWAARSAVEDDVAFILRACTRATSVIAPSPALDILDTAQLERLELRAPCKSSVPLALAALPHLHTLTLYNFHLDLASAASLPHLQRVRLVHCDVTRDWLHALFAAAPALVSVSLEQSSLWGPREDLFAPVAERLEELALLGCEWASSDVSLESFAALRALTVHWDQTSAYALPPRLDSLYLHISPSFDDSDDVSKPDMDDLFHSLASSITRWQQPALKHLHVSLSPQSPDFRPLLRAWCAQQGIAASIHDA